jgi:branched-chain amino acid aminotransferase
MTGAKTIWLDGKFVKSADAHINVLSHALHYGSSVFEGIRAYETPDGPAVFRLHDHVERFFFSADALGIKIPYTEREIERAILKTVALNKLKECYIRPIAFYGEGQMALMPSGATIHVAIAAWPWGAYLGEHAMLSAVVSPYVRFHPRSVVPGAKIGGYYATSVLATIDARKRGFNESILLDHEGNVAEGPGENIFMVRRGRLITPRSPSILPGITRDSVLAIARDLRIPVAVKKISLRDLMNADEAFFTGTAAEVASIGKVNGRRIGGGRKPGPVTRKIREHYLAATHGQLRKYKKWLAFAK